MFYTTQLAQHFSSYIPHGPQEWMLHGLIESAERPTIGPRPTVCRPLAYSVILIKWMDFSLMQIRTCHSGVSYTQGCTTVVGVQGCLFRMWALQEQSHCALLQQYNVLYPAQWSNRISRRGVNCLSYPVCLFVKLVVLVFSLNTAFGSPQARDENMDLDLNSADVQGYDGFGLDLDFVNSA